MSNSESIDVSREKVFNGLKLGQFLRFGNFISKLSLKKALERQTKTNEMLGKILVDMGVLDPLELKAVLEINKNLRNIEDALNLSAGLRKKLGELLLQAGKITNQQLEASLRIQQKTGEKLGQIISRLGFVSKEQLNAILLFQRNQSTIPHGVNNLRLGQLLVSKGLITNEQLESALKAQKISQKRIGDILIQYGYITHSTLSKFISLQNKLITAILVLILSFAPFIKAHAEQSINANEISISDSTEAHTALKIIYHASEIEVTSEDIKRGFIELPSAAQLEIQNFNLSGYIVVFKGINGPFKEITIEGLEQEVKVTSEGAVTLHPYHGRDPLMVKLKYKIVLSDDAKPGKYRLPLEISVSPLIFV